MGLYAVMIKLIQIREGYYINEDEIKSIYVSDKQLTIYMNDGEDCVIKAGEGYYKTARKALGV